MLNLNYLEVKAKRWNAAMILEGPVVQELIKLATWYNQDQSWRTHILADLKKAKVPDISDYFPD